tara:strand:- start:77 stop:1153 length:1077 start_codon:yes stop_codon:yes gene_type:complete
MKPNQSIKPDNLKVFSSWRIALPLIIGLFFFGFMIYRSDIRLLTTFNTYEHPSFYIGLILTGLLVLIRMLAYMYRIIVLSGKNLDSKAAFQIISLWEFASALTPSVIGGTAVAMFLLAKEKMSLGKSTAIVLMTAFLDELFFIIVAPILFLLVGYQAMFPSNEACLQNLNIPFLETLTAESLLSIFFVGYSILFIYLILIGYGIFVNPLSIKRLLARVFSFGLLKRWRKKAIQIGIDITLTSKQLQNESWGFWIKSFLATSIAWLARYLEANFIILSISGNLDHIIVLARSFVMWIIMMIPLTPGSSGVAETAFMATLCEYLAGYGLIIALLWRLFSYYPYIFIGVFILPKWIKRTLL